MKQIRLTSPWRCPLNSLYFGKTNKKPLPDLRLGTDIHVCVASVVLLYVCVPVCVLIHRRYPTYTTSCVHLSSLSGQALQAVLPLCLFFICSCIIFFSADWRNTCSHSCTDEHVVLFITLHYYRQAASNMLVICNQLSTVETSSPLVRGHTYFPF